MRHWIMWAAHPGGGLARALDALQPALLLAARLYVANVFFKSGLTKLDDFSSTVALFENEYRVPVLSPQVAAVAGTGAELVLPVLLALGVFSRPVSLALLAFNAIAVVSYPDISDAGIRDHVAWGAVMLAIAVFGAGRWSADALIAGRPAKHAA